MLPLQDMRRVIFGSLVNVVAHQFPEDEKQLASMLKKGHDDLAPKHIREAVSAAEAAMFEHLDRAISQTASVAKSIRR